MRRLDRSGAGTLTYAAFSTALVGPDFTETGALGSGARARARAPVVASTGLSLAQVERNHVDAKATDAIVDRLREAFKLRTARLAVVFRLLDAERRGPRQRCSRARPWAAVAHAGVVAAGALSLEEIREGLRRHHFAVTDVEFELLGRRLRDESTRGDGKIDFSTFGRVLGRQ